MRRFTLIAVWSIAACAKVGDSAPADAAAAATERSDAALAESVGLTRRVCGRPELGPEWTIDPASKGVTCRNRADCGSDPLVYCLAFSECMDLAAASCAGESIRTTFCRRDDCASDADCPAPSRCVCPAPGGDPWCVVDGCDDDGDCSVGQHCRSDESIQGVGPVQHCTTVNDLCASTRDCNDPNEACGYDATAHRWFCAPIKIVD